MFEWCKCVLKLIEYYFFSYSEIVYRWDDLKIRSLYAYKVIIVLVRLFSHIWRVSHDEIVSHKNYLLFQHKLIRETVSLRYHLLRPAPSPSKKKNLKNTTKNKHLHNIPWTPTLHTINTNSHTIMTYLHTINA